MIMMMTPMMMFCGTSTCVVVVPAANIGPPSSSAHTLPLKTLHRDQDDEEGFRRRVFHQRWNESRSGGIFAPLEKLQLGQAADRPFLSKGAIHPWAGGCGRKAQQSPGEE